MDGIIEGVGSLKDGSMVQKVVDVGRHDAGADCAGENEDDEVHAVILAWILSIDISIKELPHAEILKKRQADDILTIMSDHCHVSFRQPNDMEDSLLHGRWCNECK